MQRKNLKGLDIREEIYELISQFDKYDNKPQDIDIIEE